MRLTGKHDNLRVRTLHVWDVSSGRELRRAKCPNSTVNGVAAVAYSADGTHLYATDGEGILVFDLNR
jgi:hypothetical protein